jgi:hypothetical protein
MANAQLTASLPDDKERALKRQRSHDRCYYHVGPSGARSEYARRR